jgi:HlyD family secretion protein
MPPDRGKNISPGMEVRVEPTTIKREEYGAIVGKVVTVSDFPVTPQGMLADLHNDALVKRFRRTARPMPRRTLSAIRRRQRHRWTGKGLGLDVDHRPAEVTTREQPIDLVIPLMKQLSAAVRMPAHDRVIAKPMSSRRLGN